MTTNQVPQPLGPTPGAGVDKFFNWARNLRVVRTQDRWIGGVAGGIARHFGWDPMIVRGMFFLSMFLGGFGFLLYGLGWALLPEESDGRIHLQEAFRGHFDPALIGAGLMALSGMTSSGSIFRFALNRGFGLLIGLGWTAFWVVAIWLFVNWIRGRKTRVSFRNDTSAPRSINDDAIGADAPFSQPAPSGQTTGMQSQTMPVANGSVNSMGNFTAVLPDEDLVSSDHDLELDYSNWLDEITPSVGANETTGYPSAQPTEIYQARLEREQARAEREQARYDARLERDQARLERDQARLERHENRHHRDNERIYREHQKAQRAWEKSQTPVVKGPGKSLTSAVLGILLLLLVASIATNGAIVGWHINQILFALGMLVLGGAIVISGIRGRKSGFLGFLGFIGLFISLGTIGALGQSAQPEWWERDAAPAIVVPLLNSSWVTPDALYSPSESTFAPLTAMQAQTGFRMRFGDSNIDLTSLPISELSTDNPLIIPISMSAGNLDIVLPANVPVQAQVLMHAGNVDWLDDSNPLLSVRNRNNPAVFNTAAVSATNPPVIVLMIEANAGNISVTESAHALVGSN